MVPALIALALYLVLHFALVPLYRRHRARYSQYLPVHTQNPLSSLSTSTSGLRARISATLLLLLVPPRWAEWRYARQAGGRVHNAADDDDNTDDEEMGEDLEFDMEQHLAHDDARERRRRDGLSLSIDARGRGSHGHDTASDRRLSRELEEGFADSSDDEEPDRHHEEATR